jgi:hypothetical protein
VRGAIQLSCGISSLLPTPHDRGDHGAPPAVLVGSRCLRLHRQLPCQRHCFTPLTYLIYNEYITLSLLPLTPLSARLPLRLPPSEHAIACLSASCAAPTLLLLQVAQPRTAMGSHGDWSSTAGIFTPGGLVLRLVVMRKYKETASGKTSSFKARPSIKTSNMEDS